MPLTMLTIVKVLVYFFYCLMLFKASCFEEITRLRFRPARTARPSRSACEIISVVVIRAKNFAAPALLVGTQRLQYPMIIVGSLT